MSFVRDLTGGNNLIATVVLNTNVCANSVSTTYLSATNASITNLTCNTFTYGNISTPNVIAMNGYFSNLNTCNFTLTSLSASTMYSSNASFDNVSIATKLTVTNISNLRNMFSDQVMTMYPSGGVIVRDNNQSNAAIVQLNYASTPSIDTYGMYLETNKSGSVAYAKIVAGTNASLQIYADTVLQAENTSTTGWNFYNKINSSYQGNISKLTMAYSSTYNIDVGGILQYTQGQGGTALYENYGDNGAKNIVYNILTTGVNQHRFQYIGQDLMTINSSRIMMYQPLNSSYNVNLSQLYTSNASVTNLSVTNFTLSSFTTTNASIDNLSVATALTGVSGTINRLYSTSYFVSNLSASNASVTGRITVSNISTTSISATGRINGDNIRATNDIIAGGNISGVNSYGGAVYCSNFYCSVQVNTSQVSSNSISSVSIYTSNTSFINMSFGTGQGTTLNISTLNVSNYSPTNFSIVNLSVTGIASVSLLTTSRLNFCKGSTYYGQIDPGSTFLYNLDSTNTTKATFAYGGNVKFAYDANSVSVYTSLYGDTAYFSTLSVSTLSTTTFNPATISTTTINTSTLNGSTINGSTINGATLNISNINCSLQINTSQVSSNSISCVSIYTSNTSFINMSFGTGQGTTLSVSTLSPSTITGSTINISASTVNSCGTFNISVLNCSSSNVVAYIPPNANFSSLNTCTLNACYVNTNYMSNTINCSVSTSYMTLFGNTSNTSNSGIRLPNNIDGIDLNSGITIGINHTAGFINVCRSARFYSNLLVSGNVNGINATDSIVFGNNITSGGIQIGNTGYTNNISLIGASGVNFSCNSVNISTPLITINTNQFRFVPWTSSYSGSSVATIISATTTNPSSNVSANIKYNYSIIGNTMYINYYFYQPAAGAAGSGYYQYQIPGVAAGYAMDTSLLQASTNGTTNGTRIGNCTFKFFGNNNEIGDVYFIGSGSGARIILQAEAGNAGTTYKQQDSTYYHLGTAGQLYTAFEATIPIQT